MEPSQSAIADDRALTDARLAEERAVSDAASAAAIPATQQVLDDLIERDRKLADAKLFKFRVGVDRTLSRQRSDSPAASSSVAHERDMEEQRKKIERGVTDRLLQQERQRSDVAVEAILSDYGALPHTLHARRQNTDDQLSIERRGADTTVSALDETRDNLGETRTALTEAQAKDARQQEVLGMVAHDLRNPLSAIYLNAANIAETTKEASTREAARAIELAAVRMERLVGDLLDVSASNRGDCTF
jgi:signal transduction histidine kinase